MSVCCCSSAVVPEEVLASMVKKVVVSTGRLVDYVAFTYVNGEKETSGTAGGDKIGQFNLDHLRNEYIVRVNGRQGKYLDGIQFVTNLGRHSPWYGEGGGTAFQFTVPAGQMLVGFETDSKDNFCPRVTGLLSIPAPTQTRRASLKYLLINKNTRRLAFGGKPSIVRLSMRGYKDQPSVLKLLLKDINLIRLMFKGKSSFIREMLTGEENRKNPSSLFRIISEDSSYATIPGKSIVLLHQEKNLPSITQLLLSGKPSPARQFFGKPHSSLDPLASMLFHRDSVNGYPSLLSLFLQKDSSDSATTNSISFIESLLYGEAINDGPDISLMRLLLLGKPSIFDMLLDGEKEGKESVMRTMIKDENGDGLTIARKVLSSFDNHKGHRLALSRYMVGGELEGKSSMMRSLLAGETRKNQSSLLHLLLYRYTYEKKKKRRLLRMGSSFRKLPISRSSKSGMRNKIKEANKELDDRIEELDAEVEDEISMLRKSNATVVKKALDTDAEEQVVVSLDITTESEAGDPFSEEDSDSDGEEELFGEDGTDELKAAVANLMDDVEEEKGGVMRKRSLMQLMLFGSPSIFDLILDGELEGEDSIARLVLATSASFENGRLKLGGTLGANNKGVSLMRLMLAGEEEGGPGISFMRLLLLGEAENGFSILRLLLINETTAEPSIFRVMLTAFKGILTASRIKNKTDISRWKSNFKAIANSVISAQKKKKPLNFKDTVNQVIDTFSSGVGNFGELFKILRTIPQKGKEFERMWKRTLYKVAEELRNSAKRMQSSRSLWVKIAPKIASIAEDVGDQKWTKVVTKSTAISVDIGKLINRYRADSG